MEDQVDDGKQVDCALPEKTKKKSLDKWKLVMSSLFARSMPYLITGYEKEKWIFSNVLPAQMHGNITNSDSAIHLVKFSNLELQQDIIDMFPLFGTTSVAVNVGTISKLLNKCGFEDCLLEVENFNIWINTSSTDETLKHVLVGRILSQYDLNYYIDWIKRYITRETLTHYDVVLCPVDLEKLDKSKSEVNLFEIHTSTPNTTERRWFRLPLLDGSNFPSIYEYVKKSKLPFTMNAELVWRGHSVEVVVAFDDSNVSVRSCFPKRIWYPILETK